MIEYLFGFLAMISQAAAAVYLLVSEAGRKDHFAARLAGTLALLLLVGGLMYPTYLGASSLMLRTVFFSSVFLFTFTSSIILYSVSVWEALFCCTMGYVAQNLMSAIAETLRIIVLGAASVPTVSQRFILMVPATAVVLLAYYHLFARHVTKSSLATECDRSVTLFTLVTVVSVIGLDICIKSVMRGGTDINTVLFMRVAHCIICSFILYCGYEVLCQRRLAAEQALTARMASERERQYQLSRTNIESINIKCHDMKHQIRKLSQNAVDPAILSELTNEIGIYDSMVETGNKALDTILSEKSLICSSERISLSIIADGSALGMFDDVEVYAFFGNALDNAIEASRKVENPDDRLISVMVNRKGLMTLIAIENYFAPEHAPVFEKNLPITSKDDGTNHGFGTRSMRQIVERHGGQLTMSTEGNIFKLSVLLTEA